MQINPDADKGPRYSLLRHGLRVYGFLAALCLCVCGIVLLSIPLDCKQPYLSAVLASWLLVTGGLLALSELRVRMVQNWIRVVVYRTGRAFLYVLVGSLALFVPRVGLPCGIAAVLCGCLNFILSGYGRRAQLRSYHGPEMTSPIPLP
eukprot:NODE_6099_length_573_cov_14.251121_g5934_i0.p1 GENE.NODE_6099_length_573_cov_14.251121_g5934_i0~~NODE_6099_length_573_cov_14.251121_g5934_i0.p1  ORF type:complete len:148 (+),score=25.68 NODE_6099_length_573_cov_14.251121_g5934_i0:53-496(+)